MLGAAHGRPSSARERQPGAQRGSAQRAQRRFAGFAPAALEAASTRVADGGQVRLVTIGRYQGQRAAIIVVSPAGGGPARIWVVGAGCSATSSDVMTQMPVLAGGRLSLRGACPAGISGP